MKDGIQTLKLFIPLFLLILSLGCANISPGRSANKNPASTVDSDVTYVSPGDSLAVIEFNVFWKDFRRAVLDADTNALISMTVFPLETHQLFERERTFYESNDFGRVFFAFVKQVARVYDSEQTVLDLVQKVEYVIDSVHTVNQLYARVSDMSFHPVDGKWKLSNLILLSETVEFLKEPDPEELRLLAEYKIFWTEFRAAVISSDTVKLMEMTQFPLQTRHLIKQKDVFYEKEDFVRVFWAYLDQENDDKDVVQSQLEYIKNSPEITDDDIFNSLYGRMGSMYFHTFEGKWKLAELVLYTETIERIEK